MQSDEEQRFTHATPNLICQNPSTSLARCTFQLEVREVELSEESEEKERKVAAQRRVAQSRVVLRVKKDMWRRMGTRWLWKAELAH